MMKKKQKTGSSKTVKDRQFYIISLILVIFDQLTKYVIRSKVDFSSIKLFDFLYFTHTQNTGISFGMFKGYNWVFLIVSIIALGYFFSIYLKNRKYYMQFALICSGIIGNTIDRLLIGSVTDFIDFRIFPIFNVADSLISIGMVWLVLILVLKKEDLK